MEHLLICKKILLFKSEDSVTTHPPPIRTCTYMAHPLTPGAFNTHAKKRTLERA